MKKTMMFLIVVAMAGFSSPVVAKTGDIQLVKRSDAQTLEALKGLKIRQHTGVIAEFDPKGGELVIKNRKGQFSLSVNSETQVKRGREKLGQDQLRTGMRVTVKYWEKEGKKIARIVKLPKE